MEIINNIKDIIIINKKVLVNLKFKIIRFHKSNLKMKNDT